MIDGAVITRTLEMVAERRGDPTADVYVRLFGRYPELERLFLMDRDGGVRASMMQQAATLSFVKACSLRS